MAHERLGRMQESYVDAATSTWLSSLEKSLAQMKEYQVFLPGRALWMIYV